MTLSSTESKKSYAGDGSTEFSTPYFIANSHIVAIHSDANGLETTWTENTHYTLVGEGDENGGTLTVETDPVDYTPLSGERLVVKRVVPNTQGSDYPAGGGFPSSTVEQDFDLAVMRAQQAAETLGRALLFKDTADLTGFDPSLPTPNQATPILGVKGDGSGLEWINDSPGSAAAAKASADAAKVSEDNAAAAVVGALQASQNLSDVADAPTARTNLGVPGTGVQNTFTKTQTWAKGADVASTAILILGADGNYFDVTGTVAITSIATLGVGTVVKLHFDEALILTHHATNLVLPGSANITTAAGDEAEFVEYAAGQWRCTHYSFVSGSATPTGVIQFFVGTSAPTDWLLLNSDTIGDVGSGAAQTSARYEALFTHLWNNVADAQAPVSTGRGSSAQADWSSGKSLQLPDCRGRALVGLDNMGGVSANAITDTSADILADTHGEETHALIEAEGPAHSHTVSYMNTIGGSTTDITTTVERLTTQSKSTSSSGSGTPHNNVQPSLFLSVIIKV